MIAPPPSPSKIDFQRLSPTVGNVNNDVSAPFRDGRKKAEADLKKIFAGFSDDLASVDLAIKSASHDFEEEIRPYVDYVAASEGKRLRPLLVFLAATATGGIKSTHIKLAVVLELIHLATLVHDDIMDGADLRRGRPTVNARLGPAIAVLLGDALFAHALKLSTDLDDRHVTTRIAEAAQAVCTGEILQTRRRFDLDLSMEEYYRIIEMKTATLFEAATYLAACLNGAPEPIAASLLGFGRHLGIAYQIYDDCLDIVGEEANALKSLGTDFAKGKLTLPLIHLLASSAGEEREEAAALIRRADPVDSATLRQLVTAGSSLDAALGCCASEVDAAGNHLKTLPHSPATVRLNAFLIGARQLFFSISPNSHITAE